MNFDLLEGLNFSSVNLIEQLKVYSQFAHPLLMWVLFGVMLYAGYLGGQTFRTRTADKEIRKKLIKHKFRDKHYLMGALLLSVMVLGAIGGMAVTYINNGKLFVGPHLLAGLAMTAIIVVAAALIPLMEKGYSWARNTHIALNLLLIGLFGWEAITGMDILNRIINRL